MPPPRVWGRHFWYAMHIAALGYPDNPTVEQANAYKAFFLSIGNVLPCPKCAVHYTEHMRELPIDKALRNRRALFEWTVDLHNIVNKYAGRAAWNADYAEAFYMSGNFNVADGGSKSDGDLRSAWRYILLLMILLNVVVVVCISVYVMRNK